jgi:hypothetical protein
MRPAKLQGWIAVFQGSVRRDHVSLHCTVGILEVSNEPRSDRRETMHRLGRYLSYANVTATLALFAAVAGGTTAIAMKGAAPKNSVTSKSIRPYNVTARDLTRLIEVRAKTTFQDPAPADGIFTGADAIAVCPTGSLLYTGGGGVDNVRANLSTSGPTHDAWVVHARGDGTNEANVFATAWCLSMRSEKPTP